jgi:hypothetical protein
MLIYPRPYKAIPVEEGEEGHNNIRLNFLSGICGQYMTQNLIFSLAKLVSV